MKKIVSIICVISIMLSVCVIPVSAADNINYDFNDGVLTISGTGEVPMLESWEMEFLNDVRKVIIKEGITSIAKYAFSDVINVEEINFPDTLMSIGENAFSSCYNLKTITIPKNVSQMTSETFWQFSYGEEWGIEKIEVAKDNPYFTSIDGIVYTKDKSTLVYYPKKKKSTTWNMPDELKNIDQFSSSHEYVENINVGNGNEIYTSLDGILYSKNKEQLILFPINNKTTHYVMPDETIELVCSLDSNFVKSITVNAKCGIFPGTYGDVPCGGENLETINVSSKNPYNSSFDGMLFNKDLSKLLVCPPQKTKVVLPNSCTDIRGAFSNCGVEEVVLPSGITVIPDGCFLFCENLKSVYIPSSVKTIERDAFWRASNLQDVYYEGDSSSWNKINIDNSSDWNTGYWTGGNDDLLNATIHYNYSFNKDFENITFDNKTYTYNGTEQSIAINGTLPDGANVEYINNKGTNAGKYNAKAIITCDGYETLELEAKLIINKAPITVQADDIQIVKGTAVPELTYTIVSGMLYGNDQLEGKLSTRATGSKLGDFDITVGTLDSDNYDITFKKGTFSVVDKTVQNITIDGVVTEKVYGDDGFKITATPDINSKLDDFTMTSSNVDVATIDSDGNVTIKGAGKTTITVKQAGNAEYAPFEKTWQLKVGKANITITADNITKKIGQNDPELTYSVSGKLYGDDVITGKLKRKSGESIGNYDILIGTLAINDNYDITFKKGTFSIVDKTPQNIVVATIGEKTYGDASFRLEVTPDAASKLDTFTYTSSNTDVATIDENGNVTVKCAGTTDITVVEPGNDEFAAFSNTQQMVVNKKDVTISSVNPDEKTAVVDGVLSEDTSVKLDFDNVNLTLITDVDDTTSKVKVTNFELIGEKAENYIVKTESIETVISKANIVNVNTVATNGKVSSTGAFIKNSKVTLIATADSGYRFSGWYIGEEKVSSDTEYSFVADADINIEAKFNKISSGGGGGGSVNYTVKFNTNGGNTVKNVSVKKGGIITEPQKPEKNGYVFDGWYIDANLTTVYDFSSKVTKNITLYAKWSEIDITKSQIILTIGDKNAKVFGQNRANDVAPKIVNDHTMLPARFVAESLGATVIWKESDPDKVQIIKEGTEIIIYIGSDIAYVNNKQVKLDSPAFIENDRTYTPIRFISEELGANVEWKEETKQVIITKII